MEHGLKDIKFYVPKRIAHRVICYKIPLVRDKLQGAPKFVRYVYLRLQEQSKNITSQLLYLEFA